jgi:hypothetical protein
MHCPRCKKLIVNFVFGVACGCALLSGHGGDFPHQEYDAQPKREQIVVQSTSPTTARRGLVGSVQLEVPDAPGPSSRSNSS